MRFFTVLSFACSVLAIYAQVCPPTEVSYLIDQSENALNAASTNRQSAPFDILMNATRDFLNNPLVINAANFRVSIFGYSSDNNSNPLPSERIIAPQGSTPAQALMNIGRISLGGRAGSWTYRGLEWINFAPTYTNNILIVLSSQGSGTDARRNLAQTHINRILSLGWRVYVIGLKGVNTIDSQELTIVNAGKPPVILEDRSPLDPKDPKGYKDLSGELQNIANNILCPPIPTTTTTTTTTTTATTTTTIVQPRSSSKPGGLCDNCLFEGGFGFDFDPLFCDTFYQCLPNSVPIKKFCPAGTFWDGSTCDHMLNVQCPSASCAPNDYQTRYASGKCCNKFYQCSDGTPLLNACPIDQAFDMNSRSCITPQNMKSFCDSQGLYVCDVNLNGPASTVDCSGYAPDPFGDPCKFTFAGQTLRVAPGTTWQQERCTLIPNAGMCLNGFNESIVFDRAGSLCNAIFLADFNGGSRTVFSPRLQREITVYSSLQEAVMMDNGVSFTAQMRDPFLYYYFFNNRQFQTNAAFRIRFRLDWDQLNVNYDIMSNNYCSLCRDTVSFTATATSNTGRLVTATFLTTLGNTVSTSAMIQTTNQSDMLELIVIYGETTVYGKLKAMSGTTVYQTSDFVTTPKPAGAKIQTTKCGFQFGRGPSQKHFQGLIDEFAYYEMCDDIASILQ